MIKIVKDGNTILCSKGTYESMYKRLGYEIVKETKKIEKSKIEQPKIEEPKVVEQVIASEEEVDEIPVVDLEDENFFIKSTKSGKNKK